MLNKLVLITATLLCLAAGMILTVKRHIDTPLPLPAQGQHFVVEKGESMASVAKRLAQLSIVPSPDVVRALARFWQLDTTLRPGEYQLQPPLNYHQLLSKLSSGEVITYSVTVPEGRTLAQALARLQAHKAISADLSGVDDDWFRQLPGPAAAHPEGWFFPDTYQFVRGDSDRTVLLRAYEKLQAVLMREWEDRQPNLPYETPYDALIMASIIERETGVAGERGEIAGVFVRRLRRGMRLQTDPSVMYGIADFDGNLRRSHLRDDSNPYNTYRHHGLPPTPIALPGQAAIHAALQPKAGSSLYFVAKGDGSHQFSDTLQAHQQAVRRYQLKRRKDYRSSPAGDSP